MKATSGYYFCFDVPTALLGDIKSVLLIPQNAHFLNNRYIKFFAHKASSSSQLPQCLFLLSKKT